MPTPDCAFALRQAAYPIDDRSVAIAQNLGQREGHRYRCASDFAGEAMVALVECAYRYDPDRGTSLLTYAFSRMRGRALDAARREARQHRTRRAFRHEAAALDGEAGRTTISTRLDLARAVAAVRPQLGSCERLVLDGHYGADRSLNELAAQGRASSDQLQRAHRALIRRLREQLAQRPARGDEPS